MIGSTISTNTLRINSTLTGSTTTIYNLNYSSLTGSTISTNTLTVNSTHFGSTITTYNLNYSTLTGSTIYMNTIQMSNIQLSGMPVSPVYVNTFIITIGGIDYKVPLMLA